MSNRFEDFADGLQQEVLIEAANNYFGRRRDVEDMQDLLREKAEQLRPRREEAVQRADLLYALLLDGEAAAPFFETVNACQLYLPMLVDPQRAGLRFAMPSGLTAKKRYIRLLRRVYERTREACDRYLYGDHITDAQGRKRMSVNYVDLMRLADLVNHNVGRVNKENSASCAIGFARSMDTERMEAEKVMGAPCGEWGCGLDNSMAMAFIDRRELGIVALPDLPPLEKVRKDVTAFGKELYARHTDRLEAIVARVRENTFG